MINDRTMTAVRRCDTRWAQTDLIDRRRAPRQADSPYRRRPQRQREPINWPLVLIVAGATFLALAALAYSMAGPV